MEIVDLESAQVPLYCQCLEDWSDEMKEAGDHKERWYEKAKHWGLRVKLARDAAGTVGGMIQYLPIEHSVAAGNDLYFVACIWVHGHAKGRGNFHGKGMGKALLRAAEADARALGAKGMAAWGLWLPVWMKAGWFRRQGYRNADRVGLQQLVWKPFTPDAVVPCWIREKKRPGRQPGSVAVTAFRNGWCPGMNLALERAERVSAEFGAKVHFELVDTSDRTTYLEWGISDGLFIDGKSVQIGPPPSADKLRKLIAKRVKRL